MSLENDYWKLDGTFSSFLDEPKNIGYMSASLSNENGVFDKEITICFNKVWLTVSFLAHAPVVSEF